MRLQNCKNSRVNVHNLIDELQKPKIQHGVDRCLSELGFSLRMFQDQELCRWLHVQIYDHWLIDAKWNNNDVSVQLKWTSSKQRMQSNFINSSGLDIEQSAVD